MTTRAVLLEALSSTPSDISRIIGSLELGIFACPPVQEPILQAAEILFGLISTERENQAVIRETIFSSDGILPNDDVASPDDISLSELDSKFRHSRERTLKLLETLKPAEWQRVIRGSAKGNMTVRYYVHALVENDIEKTGQLVELVDVHRRNQSSDRKL